MSAERVDLGRFVERVSRAMATMGPPFRSPTPKEAVEALRPELEELLNLRVEVSFLRTDGVAWCRMADELAAALRDSHQDRFDTPCDDGPDCDWCDLLARHDALVAAEQTERAG